MELGRTVQLHGQALQGDWRRQHHLGGPQGGARDRLLPHGEALEPRCAAGLRLQGRVLPGENREGLGGVDKSGRDYRKLKYSVIPGPSEARSPGSITMILTIMIGPWLWIPASRLRRAPE